jgi:hypothetical protein
MLRGLPSTLLPQRSMASAQSTPAPCHALTAPAMSATSSTSMPGAAARTTPMHGASVAMRVLIPQASSAIANNPAPTGPSVSAAGVSPRGT